MAIWNRVWNVLRGRRHFDELDEELQFHIEMRARDNQQAGMAPAEAGRAARLRFGNLTVEKERTRDAAIVRWLDRAVQDARYTARSLRANRAVSGLIVLLLALGIGANTAIFSIAHALLFRALPVADPAGLVNMGVGNFMSWGYIEANESLTYHLWQQFLQRQDSLTGAFAYCDTDFDVLVNGANRETQGAIASAEAFRTLGVRPAAGRMFGPQDSGTAMTAPVVVISYPFWNRAFAADPAAIGSSLRIEGKPFTIIGVTPPRFFGMTVGRAADVYLPLEAEPYLRGKDSAMLNPLRYWLVVFGRVRPGLTREQAGSRLAALSGPAMQATLPGELPANQRPNYLRQNFSLRPAASGVSYMRQGLAKPLALLSALALLLLLLAAFTIANLLMARAAARQKEIAVRVALGASRGRILGQLALEGLSLALAGAAAGLVLSRFMAQLLVRIASNPQSPLALGLWLDWPVFGVACGTGCLTALLFGFAPAMRALRIAPGDAFKGSGAAAGPPVMRVRRLLLSGQVAITVAITIGAVLFGTTLRNVLSVDMGFDRNNVLLANVDLRHAPVAKPARVRFYTELSDRVRALGPAEAASLCIVTPISGRTWQFGAQVESSGGWQPFHTHYNAVTPEFFAAFGTRMVAGRPLSERDTPHAPPVALVNSAFARAAFGGETAIGRRVSFRDPEPRTVEIVGIVQDAKYRNLRTPVPPTLYVPFAQITEAPPFANLALRSHMPVEKVQRGLAALLSREYPDLSVKVTTLGEQVDSSVVQERTFAVIFALFGGLALCLAAAGVYGVLAYFVEQRRPELGIRIALGATTGDVRRLIYIQSFWALAAGTAAGTILALWGARFTSSMLFGVTPDQPEAYAVAIGVVAGIAVVATLIPAVRASRTEPMDLLRCE